MKLAEVGGGVLLSMEEASSSLTSLAQDGVEGGASLLIAFETSETLETGSSSTNGVNGSATKGEAAVTAVVPRRGPLRWQWRLRMLASCIWAFVSR